MCQLECFLLRLNGLRYNLDQIECDMNRESNGNDGILQVYEVTKRIKRLHQITKKIWKIDTVALFATVRNLIINTIQVKVLISSNAF